MQARSPHLNTTAMLRRKNQSPRVSTTSVLKHRAQVPCLRRKAWHKVWSLHFNAMVPKHEAWSRVLQHLNG